jgi:hypothetical protein
MADKNLKIDVSVETTGDGGTKAAEEIRQVETAAVDAQGAAQDLEQSLDSAGETTVAPEVDAAPIETATEATKDLVEGLATVEATEVKIKVDSSELEQAAEAIRDTGDAGAEASPQLLDTTASLATIVSGSQTAGQYLKGLLKLLKQTGLGGTDAAKGIGLATIALRVFNFVTKSNPYLAAAAGVAALIGAFKFFTSTADDAAEAQEGMGASAEEAAAKEKSLATAGSSVARSNEDIARTSAEAKLAVDALKDAFAEQQRIAGLNVEANKRQAESVSALAEAERDYQIAKIDLAELNKQITPAEADAQRSAARGEAEDKRYQAQQAARQAEIQTIARAYEATVDNLRAARAALDETSAQLGKGQASQTAVQQLEATFAEVKAAQAALEAVQAKTFPTMGAAGNAQRDFEVGTARKALMDAEEKFRQADQQALRERLEANQKISDQYELQKQQLEERAAQEQKGRETYDAKVNALREESELQAKLHEQGKTQAQIELEIAQAKEKQKEPTEKVAEKVKETADDQERNRAAIEGAVNATNALADAAGRASAPLQKSPIPGLNTDQPVDLMNPARPQGLTPSLTPRGSEGFGTSPSGPVPPPPVPPTGGQPPAGGEASGKGSADAITAAADRAGEAASKIEEAAADAGQRIEQSISQVESAVTALTSKLEAKIQALAARINALGG